jgi:hypothetical protein
MKSFVCDNLNCTVSDGDDAALLSLRCFNTASADMEIVGVQHYKAWCGMEEHDSRRQLLAYRRIIRLVSVGGAILPLLSSQGRSAILRWASSSNRIDLDRANASSLGAPRFDCQAWLKAELSTYEQSQ